MDEYLSQIVIILYQPQDVVNVAGIIRVMSNFGLVKLRLVEPAAFDAYRILGIAHHTEPLVDAVERYATLAAATADCALVLGTTGRPREAEHRILTPRQAAPLLLAAGLQPQDTGTPTGAEPPHPQRYAGVLFGREQDGLPNEALDLCHGVITIPTHPDNRSLNLAQAALVMAYELWTTAAGTAGGPGDGPGVVPDADPGAGHALPGLLPSVASGAAREAMFDALREFLTALYPTSTDARLSGALSRLRTLLMRAVPTEPETAALTNLCRHAARELRSRQV